mmetsp:Transcript_12802/g.30087  ORF Transcript_12802/g.30087 Transcript_12802/m.30087 type:complete len:209 (+) Transcript_12802:133-759(+)
MSYVPFTVDWPAPTTIHCGGQVSMSGHVTARRRWQVPSKIPREISHLATSKMGFGGAGGLEVFFLPQKLDSPRACRRAFPENFLAFSPSSCPPPAGSSPMAAAAAAAISSAAASALAIMASSSLCRKNESSVSIWTLPLSASTWIKIGACLTGAGVSGESSVASMARTTVYESPPDAVREAARKMSEQTESTRPLSELSGSIASLSAP